MMANSDYDLDTRIRRRYVPLVTQQRRLRHLRSISIRNIVHERALEDLALAFSLHKDFDAPGTTTPAFYASETIQEDLNPTWKDFESSNFPESIDTSLPYVVINVWNMSGGKHLIIQWATYFSGLCFLGEQIPKEGKNFKPNVIIFGMPEGYYGSSDTYQATNVCESVSKKSLEIDAVPRISYFLRTLERVKTVQRAIKQLQSAARKRRSSISARLQQSGHEAMLLQAKTEQHRISTELRATQLWNQARSLRALQNELTLSRGDLLRRREAVSERAEGQKKDIEQLIENSKYYNLCREMLLKSEAQLNFRRKQQMSQLNWIYPVVEFPDQNGFSIHNVHLPNSENFYGHDDMMISVALGYVCHIVLMISQLLNVPLRYPINFHGSRSTIVDHISSSLPEKTREFPLYAKGKDRTCFEYGVFLLNKNIAQLRILYRLSTKDLSATLPNLYTLVNQRIASNGDLPLLPNIRVESKLTTNGILQPPVSPVKAEVDFLKQEMAAMMPRESTTPLLLTPNKDLSMSSSLDKGLNDIRHIESFGEKRAEKRDSLKLLRQTSHHSSYPNLASTLTVADSQHLSTSSTQTTMDSPRTNSEDEEESTHIPDTPPVVLTDSIFYIPSTERRAPANELTIGADDFSADLSIRTEQLASKMSSFQMQRLRASNGEEELPNV